MLGQTPASVPALRRWTPASGRYILGPASRIVIGTAALAEVGTRLAEDLRELTDIGPVVVAGDRTGLSPGDVFLVLRREHEEHAGEYVLDIDACVTIRGTTARSVYHGGRTVLQLLGRRRSLAAGTARDWPEYRERGVLIDTASRRFPRRWWRDLVREMASVKLNELVVLLTGCGLDADETRFLVELTEQHHVNLTPSYGLPAHAGDLVRRYPQYALAPGSSHPLVREAFDFTAPGALDVVAAEIEGRIAGFPGRYWHGGADEYLDYPAHRRDWDAYPQLGRFARERTGNPEATGRDAYTWFLNWMNALVKRHGKVLRVWSDHLEAGVVRLDRDVIVEHWYQPTAAALALTPQQLADPGHPHGGHLLLNAHEELTYYDMGWRRLDPRRIYEDFRVHRFQGGGEVVGAAAGNLLGGRLQVWMSENVRPGQAHETVDEVSDNLRVALRAFAQVGWETPPDGGGYDDLAARIERLKQIGL